MRAHGGPSPVVVGVGDTGSATAVEWAAAEAAASGRPLRLGRAAGPHLLTEAYGVVPPMADTTTQDAARLILEEALNTALLTAPDLEVSTHLLPGPAAPALLDEARDARLLVVGSGRRRGLSARLHGSVAGFVAVHSPCPVVVVHPVPARPPVRSTPRVVVGIGPSSCAATVGFAFDAARQRGVPLVALSAWTPDAPADLASWPDLTASTRAAAAQGLEQALRPWHQRFPAISITPRLVCGEPVPALLAESSGAALVVVGSGAAGPVRRLLFGSVSRAVLKNANCAVAVVRSATAPVPTAAHPASDERA